MKDPTAKPVTCRLGPTSPRLVGYRRGVWAIVDCRNHVLMLVTRGGLEAGDGMTVPGLARFFHALPVPGQLPTLGQCASAWNAWAPAAAKNALVADHALAAVLRASMETAGYHTPPITGPQCWINIVLPGQQSARIMGFWINRTVHHWTGIISKQFLSTSRAQFGLSDTGKLRQL